MLPTVQSRITGAYSSGYNALKSQTGDAISMAFVALMEGHMGNSNATYVQNAYDLAMQKAAAAFDNRDWYHVHQSGSTNFQLGLVFDWCHSYLTASQKTNMMAQIYRWLMRGFGLRPHNVVAYHNMVGANYHGVVMSAIAAYNSPEMAALNDSSLVYLEWAREAVGSHMTAINNVGSDGGGWHEGFGYGWEGGYGLMPIAMEAWRTASDEDVFAQTPGYADQGKHFMIVARPYDGKTAHYDKPSSSALANRIPNRGRRSVWYLLASRYGDGHAQYWADNDVAPTSVHTPTWQGSGNTRHQIWQILFHDLTITAVGPSNALPKAIHLRGDRSVVMRGGYESTSDVFAHLRCRGIMGGNEVSAENTILLHRKSTLAMRSGYYAGSSSANNQNYYGKPFAGNTVWVDNTTARDLGDLPEIVFETTANFDYAMGDATKGLMWLNKVTNFTRQYIQLKPEEYFVVYDRVSGQLGNTKRWMLHSIMEPIVMGTVTSTEVPSHIINYDAKEATILDGIGKLFVNSLLPKQSHIRKVGGDGYRFWVNETSTNYPLSNHTANETGNWRMEVIPNVQAEDDVFLHLLYPAHESTSPNPTYSLLEGPTFNGLQTGNRVVLFNRVEGDLEVASYSLTATGTVKHMICDAKPGSLQVTQDGNSLGLFECTKNVLYFESNGGGSFMVNWVSGPGIDQRHSVRSHNALIYLRPKTNPAIGLAEILLPPQIQSGVLRVYDGRGRELRAFDLEEAAGSVIWDGRDHIGKRAIPGTYFFTVEIEGRRLARRITLLR